MQSEKSKSGYNNRRLNADDMIEKDRETGREKKEKGGRESRIRAARRFFVTQIPRLARKLSSIRRALYHLAESTRGKREGMHSCLCTHPRISFSSVFVRPSVRPYVPLFACAS